MAVDLPPVGSDVPIASHAADTPMRLDVLGVVTLDFKGGIRFRVVDRISSGLGGVTLEVIGNEWSADSPVLGRVTISQADVDTTPLGTLEVIDERPTLRDTWRLDWTVTIEKPPGGGPPLVLVNTRTAELRNDKLSHWPPRGAVYQLRAPVDLAPVGDRSQVVGQLMQLPMTASHNP
jgi:hypothetical protein